MDGTDTPFATEGFVSLDPAWPMGRQVADYDGRWREKTTAGQFFTVGRNVGMGAMPSSTQG